MNAQTEAFEEEYEEYDEFDEDDDDGERGLSGLVVLLMGVVMLGAFAAVVWIAYQQGINARGGDQGGAPYVAADPEPLKIENTAAQTVGAGDDRPVYDSIAGGESNPVETIAQGPEEPVTRETTDPIAAIARGEEAGAAVVDDAVADRIASLAAVDDAGGGAQQAGQSAPAAPLETPAPPAAAAPAPTPTPAPAVSGAGALAGTHLVQVGAFRSQAEANGFWTSLKGKLGDYTDGKAPDVEMADLGERGVFHRLRIGPFASADAAKTYCEGLKSRGQDCLVKAK